MGLNLIELMNGYLTPEVLSKASTFIGENEKATTSAVGSIIPTLLGGLLHKASDEDGATAIATLLSQGKHDGSILNNVLNIFNGGETTDGIMKSGSSALSGIFGEGNISSLINLISGNSGMQTGGASKLLNLVTPILLGLIGKQTAGQGVSGLVSLLTSQKDHIAASAPSGLASLLGLGSLAGIGGNISNWLGGATGTVSNVVSDATSTVAKGAQNVASTTKEVVESATESTGGLMKWLLPLLLIAAAILAALFFTKSCNKQPVDGTDVALTDSTVISTTAVEPTTTTVLGKIDSLTGEWFYDNGAMTKIQLPNNAGTIEVGENSTEAKLVAFLTGSDTIDTVKGNWFDFTNVRFKTGSSETTPESAAQLKNLVLIAKAFPTAQFKIGGYTDNTGDAAKNVALSQKRADAVAAQVVKLGAAKTAIVGAKGYGQEWPLADNATAEGRAQNRRVSVNVKAK